MKNPGLPGGAAIFGNGANAVAWGLFHLHIHLIKGGAISCIGQAVTWILDPGFQQLETVRQIRGTIDIIQSVTHRQPVQHKPVGGGIT